MKKGRYYSLPEVQEILGVTYDRVWYACVTGKVRPQVVGHTRLLTEKDIEILRELFERRDRCKK